MESSGGIFIPFYQIDKQFVSIGLDIEEGDVELLKKEFENGVIQRLKFEKIRDRVNDLYLRYLYREVEEPALSHYQNAISKGELSWEKLENDISDSEERRAKESLRERNKRLFDMGRDIRILKEECNVSNSCDGLSIKFYGPIGKTGYSQSAKAYFSMLFHAGANLSFVPTFVHNIIDNPSQKDVIVYSHIDRNIDYDWVIVEAVPNQWGEIIPLEKKKNPSVKVIGISLWETDRIPESWIPYLNMLDLLICCSEWNSRVFSKDVRLPIYTIHNPISMQLPDITDAIIDDVEDEFVFYTINEWTERKGIEILIGCFLEAFEASENVLLYIKSSIIDQDVGEFYIRQQSERHRNPPKIILDCKERTDQEIGALHRRGNCYISLTKSEGIGLGACEAASFNKPIIMTAYGGQLDYLKNVHFVGFCDENVNMCSKICGDHSGCDEDDCRIHPGYLKKKQRWANPNKDDAIRTMRYVFSNYNYCVSITESTKRYILDNFNENIISEKFASILKK